MARSRAKRAQGLRRREQRPATNLNIKHTAMPPTRGEEQGQAGPGLTQAQAAPRYPSQDRPKTATPPTRGQEQIQEGPEFTHAQAAPQYSTQDWQKRVTAPTRGQEQSKRARDPCGRKWRPTSHTKTGHNSQVTNTWPGAKPSGPRIYAGAGNAPLPISIPGKTSLPPHVAIGRTKRA